MAWNASSVQPHTQCGQSPQSVGTGQQGTTTFGAPQPAQIKHGCGKCHAEWATDVQAAFGPVQAAAAAQLRQAAGDWLGPTGLAQRLDCGLRQLQAIGAGVQPAAAKPCVAQRHAECTGEMAIAGPRAAHRGIGGGWTQGTRNLRQRHRFQPRGYFIAGQAVIPVPPLRMHAEQTAIEQALEMGTGGGRAHTGGTRQLAGRTRTPIHQRQQHGRTRRLGQQRAEFGQLVTIERGSFRHAQQSSPARARAVSLCSETSNAADRDTGCMDIRHIPDTLVIQPSILYFGTPILLITTRNPDGSTNITPMSSAWALADHVVIGLADGGQGLANLLRERECVLNVAGKDMHAAVERLAPTSGRNPVPAWKKATGYRHAADKFALAGWHAVPSLDVAPPRIAEAPLQLEARLHRATPQSIPAWHDNAGGYVTLKLEIRRVHAHANIVIPGTSHIDTRRYQPLFYVFRHYFDRGAELGRTFKAEA